MTFWDFCAPFYDRAEQTNKAAYSGMIRMIRDLTPQGASVFEAAAGTGAISLSVADKAGSVLCTDLSERMLGVARRKAERQGVNNIKFASRSLFDTGEPDNAYDVVIAAQVFHLIDDPEKAAVELKRITCGMVIAPVCPLKDLKGFFIRPTVGVWRIFGFALKREFDAGGYRQFLANIGLPPDEYKIADGRMPLAVPVWRRG
ncbi:MAG: class I SAM-dependent methyltransferase [Clostridiales bacterium]|jgi:ubiquinone/menaquinone biosynthesis C-methylase UbiE|nr:class I SAM-dependent methyltransferase [Clostridiales bacterium]